VLDLDTQFMISVGYALIKCLLSLIISITLMFLMCYLIDVLHNKVISNLYNLFNEIKKLQII